MNYNSNHYYGISIIPYKNPNKSVFFSTKIMWTGTRILSRCIRTNSSPYL